jgi:anti-anti-sigma factor
MQLTQIHDVAVIRLSGELTIDYLNSLERLLSWLAHSQQTKILLDMSQVDYLHYKIVYSMVENALVFRLSNGDLKFLKLSGEARDVVRFVGAHQVIEDFDSLSEALLSFEMPHEEQRRVYH